MLTGKQKRYLRNEANNLNAIFQIGKAGISDSQINGIIDALEAHELIKIKVLKSCQDDIDNIAYQISQRSDSEIVQTIGRVVVLYKSSDKGIYQL
ncbi:MAG: ribosome assembly RNA-binding protein YhbY [Erysipelotrichaceae bacterium]|nr:ribosome assembly RNA-binding protein YhbY [Erysipelotrichaceae bacterium]